MIPRIALYVYRTATIHLAVLVEVAKRRKAEKRQFAASPIGEPAKRLGWEDDEDTLSGMWPVRVPDESDVEVPETGRHSRGSAA